MSKATTTVLSVLLASAAIVVARAAEDPGPAGAAASRTRGVFAARIPAVPVLLDTDGHVGKRARIYVRVRGVGRGAIAEVQWRARALASGALNAAGDRALVFEGTIDRSRIDDVFDFEVAATARVLAGTAVLEPVFEIEHVNARGDVTSDVLRARTVDGPLQIPVHAWALVRPEADGGARSPEPDADVPAMQPTGRGVRLEGGTRGRRLVIVPESTHRHGLRLGGAFASALFGGAAGVVGSASEDRDEVIVNSIWPVAGGRLTVTAGRLRDRLALDFGAAGTLQPRLVQRGAGAGYQSVLGGRWAPQLSLQGYFFKTPTRNLGSYQFSVESASMLEVFRASRRVSGSTLLGFQSGGAFAPARGSTFSFALGAEQLAYDLTSGRDSSVVVTGGIGWVQRLPRGYSLQARHDRHVTQSLRSVQVGRELPGGRHRLDFGFEAIDGRRGLPGDARVRVGYSRSFGAASTASAPTPPAEGAAPTDLLLAQATLRPAFMPFVPIARVDASVPAERLVAVDKAHLPHSASVDRATGTVAVPADVVEVVGITRNGAAFVNTGQFTQDGARLLVHPMHMEQPPAGTTDVYIVSVRDAAGSITDITIRVEKGSVHVLSIAVDPRAAKPAAAEPPSGELRFVPRRSVPRETVVASSAIELAEGGPVSVAGGEYSLDGGAYTAASGQAAAGQSVSVRLRSASAFSTESLLTLRVGGVTGVFSVTTESEDTVPDAFQFTSQSGVARGHWIVSNEISVSGVNAPAPVSVVGGEYDAGSGYTTSNDSITDGRAITVRVMSPAEDSTSATVTLTIGGVSADFVVTTGEAPDTTPDAFAFAPQSGAQLNSVAVSDGITVAGISAPAAISIAGGEYSTAGGPFTSGPGTVALGDAVTVRLTVASTYATTTTATLTIGGVSGSFSVTTEAEPADTTPDGFSFAAQSGVSRSAVVTSNSIAVSGINMPVAISVAGGEYSIAGGAYTGVAGTVANGQTVAVRLTASNHYSSTATATLTIGGVSADFSVTTENDPGPDWTPDPFALATKTNVNPGTPQMSESVVITGISAGTPISVSASSEYRLGSGGWTSTPGTVDEGDSVRVRHTAAAAKNTPMVTTLTVGTVSGTFTSITKP